MAGTTKKTKSYSEQVAGLLDGEVREIIDRAYGHCEKILQEDREKLFQVVEFLLAHETMSGAQFKGLHGGPGHGRSGSRIPV